jgi:hypothetical protein
MWQPGVVQGAHTLREVAQSVEGGFSGFISKMQVKKSMDKYLCRLGATPYIGMEDEP